MGQSLPISSPQSNRGTIPTLQVKVWALMPMVTILVWYGMDNPMNALHTQYLGGEWALSLFHEGPATTRVNQRLNLYSIRELPVCLGLGGSYLHLSE